jgi:outer membrane protein OmpA-like peptidoglycan-associated protein
MRRVGRTPIGTVAREASQTAEEARVMSLKRQEEERVQAEKDAAAAREAQSKAEAERSKQEAELEAQKAALQKQQADAAQAAALAQQQTLQAENEKTRLQAEEAERGRQKAEADKAELRARLLQQLNAILVTRDTARGLVATMPDVLFETNSFTLRPPARESLAKFAGILLAYPDLRVEVDGHRDGTGSDAYNQQLSEKRAASVRDYLVQQGLPMSSATVLGFGKTQP